MLSEPTRTWIECYALVADLIQATCTAVENMRPGEVGEWYAERLERCARLIREKAKDVTGVA